MFMVLSQMDSHLTAMNGVMKPSFNVKDLLDLPEHQASCGGEGSPVLAGHHVELPSVVGANDAASNATPYGCDPNNPYYRWMQNSENMTPYSGGNTFFIPFSIIFIEAIEF